MIMESGSIVGLHPTMTMLDYSFSYSCIESLFWLVKRKDWKRLTQKQCSYLLTSVPSRSVLQQMLKTNLPQPTTATCGLKYKHLVCLLLTGYEKGSLIPPSDLLCKASQGFSILSAEQQFPSEHGTPHTLPASVSKNDSASGSLSNGSTSQKESRGLGENLTVQRFVAKRLKKGVIPNLPPLRQKTKLHTVNKKKSARSSKSKAPQSATGRELPADAEKALEVHPGKETVSGKADGSQPKVAFKKQPAEDPSESKEGETSQRNESQKRQDGNVGKVRAAVGPKTAKPREIAFVPVAFKGLVGAEESSKKKGEKDKLAGRNKRGSPEMIKEPSGQEPEKEKQRGEEERERSGKVNGDQANEPEEEDKAEKRTPDRPKSLRDSSGEGFEKNKRGGQSSGESLKQVGDSSGEGCEEEQRAGQERHGRPKDVREPSKKQSEEVEQGGEKDIKQVKESSEKEPEVATQRREERLGKFTQVNETSGEEPEKKQGAEEEVRKGLAEVRESSEEKSERDKQSGKGKRRESTPDVERAAEKERQGGTKKRGRPKRVREASEIEPEGGKRRPGCPKKVREPSEDEPEAEGRGGKKKPGRPKKIRVPSEVEPEGEGKGGKRKPGRPKRVREASESEREGEGKGGTKKPGRPEREPSEKEPEGEGTGGKRKPGRPKKVREPSEKGLESERKGGKRKPGRPKRVREPSEDELEEAGKGANRKPGRPEKVREPSADEPEGEETGGKRSPGRPKKVREPETGEEGETKKRGGPQKVRLTSEKDLLVEADFRGDFTGGGNSDGASTEAGEYAQTLAGENSSKQGARVERSSEGTKRKRKTESPSNARFTKQRLSTLKDENVSATIQKRRVEDKGERGVEESSPGRACVNTPGKASKKETTVDGQVGEATEEIEENLADSAGESLVGQKERLSGEETERKQNGTPTAERQPKKPAVHMKRELSGLGLLLGGRHLRRFKEAGTQGRASRRLP